MAGERPTTFWPLFDLVVRTPRLELRLPREDEFADMVELGRRGDPRPRDDALLHALDRRRAASARREAAQWMWRHRADWSPDNWSSPVASSWTAGPSACRTSGRALPRRALRRDRVVARPAHQGQGLGREMREAVLHLAFAGLGAEEALSGAFEDNAPRWRPHARWGTRRTERREAIAATARAAPSGSAWGERPGSERRRSDIEIIGLEGCLDMFVGPTG